MAYNGGGDTDKRGNRYEINFAVSKYISMIDCNDSSKVTSVQVESYYIDQERGVDVITEENGEKICYQCKSRDVGYLNVGSSAMKSVIEKSIIHIKNGYKFVLVSPYWCDIIDTITYAVKFPCLDDYKNNCLTSKDGQNVQAFKKIEKCICEELGYSQEILWKFLTNFSHETFNGDKKSTIQSLKCLGVRNRDAAYSAMYEFAWAGLGVKKINDDIRGLFETHDVKFATIDAGNAILAVDKIKKDFILSIGRLLINKELIKRDETQAILELISSGNRNIIIHGESGTGKSGVVYELVKSLGNVGYKCLPINLSVTNLKGNSFQIRQEMGIESSPVEVLEEIIADRKGVLILDQLDAIRWSNGNNAEFNSCCNLIKEASYYDNIIVIIVSRTIDLERMKNIFQCADAESELEYSVVQIDNLSESSMGCILKTNNIVLKNERVKKMLLNINTLNIYLSLENRTGINSVQQLYGQYLKEKYDELDRRGIGYDKSISVVWAIKDLIYKTGKVNVSRSRLNKISDTELDYFISVGLLVSNKNKISFIHQSLVDYLLAQDLYNKFEDKGASKELFKDKKEQILEDYERVKQFLEILRAEENEGYLDVIRHLIFSEEVKFFLTKAALESFKLYDKKDANSKEIVESICQSKKYGYRYIDVINNDDNAVFEYLLSNGCIASFLDKVALEHVYIVVSKFMQFYNDDTSQQIDCLIISVIEGDIDKKIKSQLINALDFQKITMDLYKNIFIWLDNQVINDLHIECNNLINNSDKFYYYVQYVNKNDTVHEFYIDLDKNRKELEIFTTKYCVELLALTKDYFYKKKSEYSLMHSGYFDNYFRNGYDFKSFMIDCYESALIKISLKALYNECKSEYMLYRNSALQALCNRNEYDPNVLFQWMLNDNYIMKYNFFEDKTSIWEIYKLIKKHIPCLNEGIVLNLKSQILNYKPMKLIEQARLCFEYRKSNDIYHYFEEEQKVLLDAFDDLYLSQEEVKYKKYLARKFSRLYHYQPIKEEYSGFRRVVSAIDDKIDKLTVANWLKIVNNTIFESNSVRINRIKGEYTIVSSKDSMVRSFNCAIKNNQIKFKDIHLYIDGSNEFSNALCLGMAYGEKNKSQSNGLNLDNALDVIARREILKKYYNINNGNYLNALMTFFQSVDEFNDWDLEKLEEIIFNSNKYEDNWLSSLYTKPDVKVEEIDLEVINKVQTRAINELGRLMTDKPNIDLCQRVLDMTINSGSPSLIMSSMSIIYAICKFDEKLALDYYEQMIRADYRSFYDHGNYFWIMLRKYTVTMNKLLAEVYENCDDKAILAQISAYVAREFILGIIDNDLFEIIIGNINMLPAMTRVSADVIQGEYDLKQKTHAKYILEKIRIASRENVGRSTLFYRDEFYNRENIDILVSQLKELKSHDKIMSGDTNIHPIFNFMSKQESIKDYSELLFVLSDLFIENEVNIGYNSKDILSMIVRLYSEYDNKNLEVPQMCMDLIEQLLQKYVFLNLV